MKALKRGSQRVYFPEFPNHHLNGAAFEWNGIYTGEENGLKKRRDLTVFEENDNNINRPSDYWEGSFKITTDMFGVKKIRVDFWFGGEVDESYILEA